ncbi:MAG: ABC transporter substrate-binding protein [Oscillospiraceae bacterium]|nr:ABC transporter substrate-binding protein [Oscillospiraceae bacterium]
MKKTLRRVIALLVICLMVFMLAACNKSNDNNSNANTNTDSNTNANTDSNSNSNTNTDSNTNSNTNTSTDNTPSGPVGGEIDTSIVSARDSVSMAITADVGTLNPLYLNGWAPQQCIFHVYEPLWAVDGSRQNIIWRLATGYEVSPDGCVWTIHLREGVKFSNGSDFTAEDVLFSMYLANHREGEPPWFLYMLEDENKIIDDYTLEFHFSKFLVSYRDSFYTIPIFDKDSYDADTVSMVAVGTGPYTVSDYVIDSHLILEARDDYWGGKLPIKTINYRFMAEDAQRVNALEAGEVDISAVPSEEIEYVDSLPNIDVRLVPAYTQRTLYCNNTNPDNPFFDNLDARKAVLLAVNPEPILRIVYNNYGALSRGPYTVYASNANEADFDKGMYDGSGYNPDLARELAISSGLAEWTQTRPLRFINNGAADMVMCAELIQSMLDEVGIKTQILTYDPGSWLTYRFDHTAYDITVDFTGSSETVSDITLWWQYCGNNSGSSGNPDPAGVERLRALTDGDETTQALAEEPNAANRVAGISEMVDILNEQFLFKNLVDMLNVLGVNQNLSVSYLAGEWVDFRATYWVN